MREDPVIDPDGPMELRNGAHNIVSMPNLTNGRLAELLAAASGPAQEHELRGELGARTAFLAAAAAWPRPRRRIRRTPAVLAVTAVATMMVATTGLAAASELPGSAGRAVEGILGSVGVISETPAPTSAPPPAPVAEGSSVTVGGSPAGLPPRTVVGGVDSARGTCTSLSGSSTASVTGGIETASCTVPVHRVRIALAAPATATTVVPSGVTSPPPVKVGRHPGRGAASYPGGSVTPPSIGQGANGAAGGGTSRGGNVGGGTGTCSPGTDGSGASTTTTTEPSGSTGTTTSTTGASTTSATAATTTTTLATGGGETTTGAGCGDGGHHHGIPVATAATTDP
ncbi:MAG: hypothetical protein ABSB09_14160 [Acidimicrobiales bacterium]|jgi:hypothetical protein